MKELRDAVDKPLKVAKKSLGGDASNPILNDMFLAPTPKGHGKRSAPKAFEEMSKVQQAKRLQGQALKVAKLSNEFQLQRQTHVTQHGGNADAQRANLLDSVPNVFVLIETKQAPLCVRVRVRVRACVRACVCVCVRVRSVSRHAVVH